MYVNGAALARGFMQNTSGGINDRKDFYGNTVRAEGILAKTDSQEFAYSASASGFANQMMNTASAQPMHTARRATGWCSCALASARKQER